MSELGKKPSLRVKVATPSAYLEEHKVLTPAIDQTVMT